MEQPTSKHDPSSTSQECLRRILTIGSVSDDRLAGYLGQGIWTPLVGALLINNIDPHSLDGQPSDIHALLDNPAAPGWLNEEKLSLLEMNEFGRDGGGAEASRKIVAHWRTMSRAPSAVPPKVFLMWCKHRDFHGIDKFLHRARKVYPAMFKQDPLCFTDLQRMKAACPSHLQSIFDDAGLIPSNHAPTVPVELSTGNSDKEGKRGKRAAIESDIRKAQQIARQTNRDPFSAKAITDIFEAMISDKTADEITKVVRREGIEYTKDGEPSIYAFRNLREFLAKDKKKAQ